MMMVATTMTIPRASYTVSVAVYGVLWAFGVMCLMMTTVLAWPAYISTVADFRCRQDIRDIMYITAMVCTFSMTAAAIAGALFVYVVTGGYPLRKALLLPVLIFVCSALEIAVVTANHYKNPGSDTWRCGDAVQIGVYGHSYATYVSCTFAACAATAMFCISRDPERVDNYTTQNDNDNNDTNQSDFI